MPESVRRRILIVDDDGAAKELDSALERAGLETLRVFAPRHLEQVVGRDRPGAILVPALRPDAVQWVNRIRALEGGRELPVLMYGFGAAQDRVSTPGDALEAGADYFFKLPTDMDYLAGRVAAWTESPPSVPPPSEVPTGSFTLEALEEDRDRPGDDGLPLLGALRGEAPGDESWSWVQVAPESHPLPEPGPIPGADTAVDEGPPIPEARSHLERTDPNLQAPPVSEGSTHDAIVVPDTMEGPPPKIPPTPDSSGQALLRDADLALAEDRPEDALEALETASAIFRADDDPAAARAALDRALALAPTRIDLAQTAADLALEEGQLEEACRALETCAEAWGPAYETRPLWERLSQLRPEVPRYTIALETLTLLEDDHTQTPDLDPEKESRPEEQAEPAPEPDADRPPPGALDVREAEDLAALGSESFPEPVVEPSRGPSAAPGASGPRNLLPEPDAGRDVDLEPEAEAPRSAALFEDLLEEGAGATGSTPVAIEGGPPPQTPDPAPEARAAEEDLDELATLAPPPASPPAEAMGEPPEPEDEVFDPRAFAAFLEAQSEAAAKPAPPWRPSLGRTGGAEPAAPAPEAPPLPEAPPRFVGARSDPPSTGPAGDPAAEGPAPEDDPAAVEVEDDSPAWREQFRAALAGRAELPVPPSRPPRRPKPSRRPGFRAWLEASQIPVLGRSAEPAPVTPPAPTAPPSLGVEGPSTPSRAPAPAPVQTPSSPSAPPSWTDAWGAPSVAPPPAPPRADSWASSKAPPSSGAEAGELGDPVAAVRLLHRLHEAGASGLLQWNGEQLVLVDGEPRAVRGHRALDDLEERFGSGSSRIPKDGPLRPGLLGLARVFGMSPSALDLDLSRSLEEALGRFVAFRGRWRFEPQTTRRDEWLPPLPLRERLADAVADHVPFELVWAEVAGPLQVDPRRPVPRRERDRRLLALLGTHPIDEARRMAGLTRERAGALALVWLGQGLAQKDLSAAPTPTRASGPAAEDGAPVPHEGLVHLLGPERLRRLLQLARTSDYFRLLDVGFEATPPQVDRAHAFVKSLLPEAHGGDADAHREEVVEILDEARAVLRDPRLRDAYKAHVVPT